ncbi:MAG: DUF2283 domain-containing protein [Nitrospirae bacterium]|nr:DUF2283 domain-containing protein [Candidatus Troglogloeales bacterium]
MKVAETKTVTPGVHADFDRAGKLIGIAVIDASEMVGKKWRLVFQRLWL